MITKNNLKNALQSLGFENRDEIYEKKINNYILKIDYKIKILITQEK